MTLRVADIARKASELSALRLGYHVDYDSLMGAGRSADLCRVRFAVALAAKRNGYSHNRIGRVLKRNPTTIWNGIHRAEAFAETSPAYAAFIEELSK